MNDDNFKLGAWVAMCTLVQIYDEPVQAAEVLHSLGLDHVDYRLLDAHDIASMRIIEAELKRYKK